ncbi:MAG: FliG C-terminal domain-containing protein [Candidatus Marinamargulisbacteria bacterium]
MTKNNNLSSLDKCIILLTFVNEHNPGLFGQIIAGLPRKFSQDILNQLKIKRPLYSKDEVSAVLNEYNDLAIEKTMLFPNESFKDHLQQKLADIAPSIKEPSHSNHEKTYNLTELRALLKNEPDYFSGLLCHLIPTTEFSKLMGMIPKETAQRSLAYFTKINIRSQQFKSELAEFIHEKTNQDGVSYQETDQQTKELAQLIELMPESEKHSMKTIIPASIAWHVIEDQLLNVDSIQKFSSNDQQIILSTLPSNQALADSLCVIPSHIRTELMKQCLTTRQHDIILEELDRISTSPYTESEMNEIRQSFIKHMRQLINSSQIRDPFNHVVRA